jgi:arginine decarboxylase
LEPHGTIKAAQELAAQTFGSDRTFWVTNGTSTANKIVVQGLVRPGDIVLVDRYIFHLYPRSLSTPSSAQRSAFSCLTTRNCHKSHHLGLSLVGASVVYLEAYPLRQVRQCF